MLQKIAYQKKRIEKKIEKKKKIQEQILKKQKENIKKIEELNDKKQLLELNKSISESESLSLSFDTSKKIQNGVELLNFIITNHAKFLRVRIFSKFLIKLNKIRHKYLPKIKKPTNKPSHKFENIIHRNLREKEKDLFLLEDDDENEDNNDNGKQPTFKDKKKMKKKTSEKINVDYDAYKKYNIGNYADNNSSDDTDNENEKLISNQERRGHPDSHRSSSTQNPLHKKSKKRSKKASTRKITKELVVQEENSALINDTNEQIKINQQGDTIEHLILPNNEEENEGVYELIEYDKFYKEQFFTQELFKEETHVEDDEDHAIKKEIERLKFKKKIKEKQKIRDVNLMKGLDVTALNKEIENLKNEYEELKNQKDTTINLQMNNVERYFQKGKELNNYFKDKKDAKFIKFTIQSEKDIKSKEIIDFQPLRKEEQIRRFYDRCCCLKCRKKIFEWQVKSKYYCGFIVNNQYFDYLSLFVIITNTLLILISDPRNNNSIANTSDQYFLFFYTFEAILKILGFGFVAGEKAYLKDYWNILDGFVVLVGWVSFIIEKRTSSKKISGLAGLRAFRILRPLKTVKSVKGLRKLVVALLSSLGKLSDILIVLVFFFLLFAIAGVQMWQGNFLKRCMNLRYGFYISYDDDSGMCTFDSDCDTLNERGNKYICSKGFRNPNKGVITFDNTLTGFVTVFIIVTKEGWTDVWTYVSKTFKDKLYLNPFIIFFYFHVLIFVGGFYLMNLFLAVTNSEFNNIEKIRRAFFEKRSFLALMKSKYDLKEKEKQEKKRKEKELKKKNQRKTDDDITDLQIKIEDEAFEIRKRPKDIPLNYTTIKDMYILQNSNPEEIYQIEEQIDEEKSFLKKDIKRQLKNLYQKASQKKKDRKLKKKVKQSGETTTNQNSTMNTDNSSNIQEDIDDGRNNGNIVTDERQRIFPLAVELAIQDAQKIVKKKMLSFQSGGFLRKAETIDLLRQKIEKKEIEKFNMNQISIEEDLSFEKEQRKYEGKTQTNTNMKKKQFNQKNKLLVKKKTLKQGNQLQAGEALKNASTLLHSPTVIQKKVFRKINDDLSFMTDISYESSVDDKLLSSPRIERNEELRGSNINNNDISTIKGNNTNSSFITNDIPINDDITLNTATKRTLLDEKRGIFDDIVFPRPSSLLPELLQLQNDEIVKAKLDKMREHFKVDKYLNKEEKKGVPVYSLDKRGSFLHFLRFTEEFDNKAEILKKVDEESLQKIYDDNDYEENNNENKETEQKNSGEENEHINLHLSLSSRKTLSDQSILPSDLPQESSVYDCNLAFEELDKEIGSSKYARFGRTRFLDKKSEKSVMHLSGEQLKTFFNQMNVNLNNNVLIDKDEPLGRINNELIQSHIFVKKDFSFEEDAENASKAIKGKHMRNPSGASSSSSQNERGLAKKKKRAKDNIMFKSKSVERNELKYPIQNSVKLIVEEVNEKMSDTFTPQQELISQNWRSRKFYMNYLYNIKDKDIKVKDSFKIDTWKNDVLGPDKRCIKLKPLPESMEAVYVFNDKRLNLKKYRYVQNRKYEFTDEECAYLTHNLTNLPINILEITPLRMRDFGRYAVGKEVKVGTLASSSMISKTLSSTGTTRASTLTSSNTKGKSSLNFGSTFSTSHKALDESKYKKGIFEKIFRKLDDFNYKTLSHYFLEEETLYFKLADDAHREEKEKAIRNMNKAKQDVLEVKSSVGEVKIFDIKTNSSRYVQWSGQDALYNAPKTEENYERFNEMITALENFGVIIWIRTPGMKILQKIKYALYLISVSTVFDLMIILIVITNSIIMALDGNMFTPESYSNLNITNYIFNGIFIAEFLMKLVGLGPIVYFSDPFTYLDFFIIIFAIIDMTGSSSSSADTIGSNKALTSQLSFLRVFRIFRVLRLTKILRKLKSMRLIIVSIQKSVINLLYILMILLMFILIFQLLGMSLLNGNIRYQSFMISFYTTFQVLTVESWNKLLYELWPLSKFVFFYYLVWIFLGNYILFNLFISILLQSFDDSDKDEDDDENTFIEKNFGLPDYLYKLKEEEIHKHNKLKNIKTRKNRLTLENEFDTQSASQSGTRMSRTSMSGLSNQSESNDESSTTNMFDSNNNELDETDDNTKVLTGIDKNIKNWKKINILFRKNECENSLYIFSQINIFRVWCMKLVSAKLFETIILIFILLSTARLILATIVSGYTFLMIFDICDLCFNFIFLFEMILKIISLGLVLDEGSYLRDHWNKIDFVIVVVSMVDIQSLVQKYFTSSSSSSSFNFIKVLRLLRTLRPLRFISHNVQLRLLINCSDIKCIVHCFNSLFHV